MLIWFASLFLTDDDYEMGIHDASDVEGRLGPRVTITQLQQRQVHAGC